MLLNQVKPTTLAIIKLLKHTTREGKQKFRQTFSKRAVISFFLHD